MKSLLRLLPTLLVCSLLSALIAVPSYMLFMGRAVTCAMSLGCSGTSSTIFDLLAPWGLLAPFVIFPLGALALRDKLRHVYPSAPGRHFLLGVVATFPLLLVLGFTFVQRAVVELATYHPHEGVNTQYYSNGQVSSIVSYHNGQLDGEYTRFCRAGKIAYHGFFKAGKPIGQKEEQNCDVDSKTITVISGQGKEIYLARYVNGVLREEIKKSTPNWEWSVFAANGSLELKRIGDQVVYQRNVPTIQTK